MSKYDEYVKGGGFAYDIPATHDHGEGLEDLPDGHPAKPVGTADFSPEYTQLRNLSDKQPGGGR